MTASDDRSRGMLARLLGGRWRSAEPEPAVAPARWARVERIFAAAVEAGDEAPAVIERECAGDAALAREVESLLAAHRTVGAADRFESELRDPTRGAEPAPGERIGRYEILERLGGGGMGVVYAARDERLGRTVALKVLPPILSADPGAMRRFLLEARSAAALDHPNICSIHEIAESEDGRLFIAMPLYRGEALDARIGRGPLPVGDALELAVAVARGLEHAHARGIVHRDIKPANLFLVEDGAVKILDFGIAKVADIDLTHSGAILGTVPYMSPEQAGGGEVDRRTDLWALGVVLYEMIAGRRPFEAPTTEATIAAILSREPAPLAAGPGSDAANRVVRRLLTKDPAARVPDAGAAVEALESALEAAVHGPVWEGGQEGPAIAPDGERRQVAVLGARIGGFADLIERCAPDELERAVERIRAAAADIAARHGGVVHRCTGDTIVCLFGVPTTHEDDIDRAVRAAGELHVWGAGPWAGDAVESPAFGLSVGVCAGAVVVQPDPATRSHRVIGVPLESASRLAAHASRDETLVGPECQRLLAGRFELEPAAPLVLPGDPAPARPFAVVSEGAVAAEPADTTAHGPLTPFAGRERELAALQDALAAALSGEGQFATVEGEAGAGKSRLLHEWAEAALGPEVQAVRVWCRPQRLGAPPYFPFVQAVRELLELGGGPAHELEGRAVQRAAHARAVELEDSLPLLLHLLGVAGAADALPRHLEGERFRNAVRDTLSALFTLGTEARPLVLVLEDWHWADEASHEVLKQLAELAPAYRLMVVVSYRPEHGVEWSEAMFRRSVRLGPLEPGATEVVIRAVLGAESVPAEVAAAIHRRAGGNPFFVEELCHALLEQGAASVRDGRAGLAGELDALHLPATIQGVIRTRLDRLDPDARDVARTASVAGRDFTNGLLRRLVSPDVDLARALDRLRSAGLIHRTKLVPEPAYRFKHMLTQEVIYDTLLAHRRRALHALVGRALETLHADRPDELADVLAYHFGRAESWREAVRYGREAARQAQALSEYPRALRTIEQVEAWASKLAHEGERRDALLGVLLEQERLCETLGLRQRQQELIDRLVAMLDPDRDRLRAAEVYRRQGDLHVLLKRFDDARGALDRALELCRAAGSPETERGVLLSRGLLCWHAGQSRDGISFLQQALAIDRERGATDDIARDLFNLGTLHRALGEWDRASEALQEALTIVEQRDPPFEAYVLWSFGMVCRMTGDDDGALTYWRRVLELDRAHGLLLEMVYVLSAMANIHFDRGDVDAALATFEEAIEIGRRVRAADGLSLTLRALGDVLVGLGRDAEALPNFREAADLFATLQNREAEADVRARIGELEERRGEHRAAADAWLRVRELRAAAGDPRRELDAAANAARALRETGGETEQARGLFRDALAIAERIGDRAKLGELFNAAGILEWRARDYERALAFYERAHANARERGDATEEGLALNSIGATLLCLHRLDDARARLEEAVAHNRRSGQALLEGHALGILGDAHLGSGETDDAARCYEASLAIRRRIGDRRGEGWMLHQLARAAEIAGDRDRAAELRADARRIAGEVGDAELETACDLAARGGDESPSEPWRPRGGHDA